MIAAVSYLGTANAVTVDMSYLIGKTEPGAPSGLTREVERLTYFIDLYNGGTPTAPDSNTYTPFTGVNVAAAPLPAYGGTSTGQNAGGFTSTTLDFGAGGWDYLMVKWANDAYYYWIGGLTGTHQITNDVVFNTNNVAQNASHWRLFNPGSGTAVPDGGTTVALLGLSMLGLGIGRKKLGLK